MRMKKVTMVQVLFILVCLIGYGITCAQSDYIVDLKGDTLRGKVKYMNFTTDKKIQFTNAEGKKSTYTIIQARAFSMDGEVYHPVRTANGYNYMKLVKGGYLSMYYFQLPNQVTWNGTYLLKKDGNGMEMPTLTFKKQMTKFLSECTAVTSRITLGELGKNDINAIIDQFNACIQDHSAVPVVQTTVQPTVQPVKAESWTQLENEVKSLNDFGDKTNALDMIAEIKTKLSKGEKVPNFLLEGIKASLKDQETVKATLEKALQQIKN
jgi:hypothetical protein